MSPYVPDETARERTTKIQSFKNTLATVKTRKPEPNHKTDISDRVSWAPFVSRIVRLQL